MRVYLSASEIAICNYVGKYRHFITSKQGKERKQDATLDSEQMSITGVLTEYSVAKMLNLFFDMNCDFRKFGADLESPELGLIDVKCAKTYGGNLNAVAWSASKPCDAFVLTEIHHSHVLIVGWIESATLLHDSFLRDVGNGSFYSMPQTLLKKFDEQRYAQNL